MREFFEQCGPVSNVTFKGRFAFVEFENSKDAAHAIDKLHGENFKGSKIDVEAPRKILNSI